MQATRESRVVCVCVCVCVITRWFVFMSNSQFITTTRLISFHRLQPKTFLLSLFSLWILVCASSCWKARRLVHKRKSSLKGKKNMFPTSFSCSNQLNSTPSPRFQCNNNCVLSLHFFPHSSCLVTSYMLHTSISSSSSSSSGYVSNLVFFQ